MNRLSSFLIMFAAVPTFVGCELPARLTAEQAQSTVVDKPTVIEAVDDKVTLEGLPQFFLGQSNQSAEKEISKICGIPTVYEGGFRREGAVFKGCATPDDQLLHSFRIGFHPKLDNAVFTLEVKRKNVSLDVVRARFYTELESPFEDLPRRGIVRMRSEKHNLFASHDSGDSGPVHIVLGTNPDTF